MHDLNIKKHLAVAASLIKAHPLILVIMILLSLFSATTLVFQETTYGLPLNVLETVLTIISTPVFYGIYFELIEKKYSSVGSIIRTYVPGYLFLLIRMYLPIVMVTILPILLAPGAGNLNLLPVILIAFSLVYIYVIPLYYLAKRQQGVISQGISFLLRNLMSSAPLVLSVLLLEVGMLLLQMGQSWITDHGPFFTILLNGLIAVGASIGDFVIFIILVLILKDAASGKTVDNNHR